MEYFSVIIPKLTSFFLLIVIGLVISRLGIVPQNGLSVLSGLLIKLVLPCLTVSILHQRCIGFYDLYSFRPIVTCQVAGYLVLAITGVICARLAQMRFPLSNVHEGCMVGGNFGFVVIPILMALYTTENGQQYIPVCMAVDTIVVWTLGVALFTHGIGGSGRSWYRILASRLINPIFVSIACMLTLNSLHIRLPGPVLDVCDGVAGISYSLGLIYVGCTMFFMKRECIAYLKTIWMLVLAKLYAIPLLMWYICSRFLTPTESITVMLVLAAPSMTTSCMIANQYSLDEDYASAAVFTTTISCMVTIPLLFLSVSYLS